MYRNVNIIRIGIVILIRFVSAVYVNGLENTYCPHCLSYIRLKTSHFIDLFVYLTYFSVWYKINNKMPFSSIGYYTQVPPPTQYIQCIDSTQSLLIIQRLLQESLIGYYSTTHFQIVVALYIGTHTTKDKPDAQPYPTK